MSLDIEELEQSRRISDVSPGHDDSSRQLDLIFKITGAASVARLEPLLLRRDWIPHRWKRWRDESENYRRSSTPSDSRACVDFVWETTVTKSQRMDHRMARVLNRLNGAQVLEDKANLALLQRRMTAPTLQSYVLRGRIAVTNWAHHRFHSDTPLIPSLSGRSYRTGELHQGIPGVGSDDDAAAGGQDWWCVKAAGGNGGMDIWVLHAGNWRSVTEELHEGEDFVIQRYVAKPMLWRGRKFHFRCYAAVAADLSTWLYRTAYILCASRAYSLAEGQQSMLGGGVAGIPDELMHISNLAVNKHTKGHPGQVPCDVPTEYPLLWPKILELVRSLINAASPFMQHQAAVGHFEFLGLDIIADQSGGVWLMEVNRLPGLQSSQQNRLEENKVYDGMMVDVIRLLVLPPIVGCAPVPGLFEMVAGPTAEARVPSAEIWRNVMRFAAFKRACKRK